MPTFELKTNVKLDNPGPFIEKFTKFAAELLDKPLSYMAVSYTYNEWLYWGGSSEPAFILNILSLGHINPEENAANSKAIFEFLSKEIGAPGHRGYISFHDPTPAFLGHEGTTFETIFGSK